jgi:hypothetical protein
MVFRVIEGGFTPNLHQACINICGKKVTNLTFEILNWELTSDNLKLTIKERIGRKVGGMGIAVYLTG